MEGIGTISSAGVLLLLLVVLAVVMVGVIEEVVVAVVEAAIVMLEADEEVGVEVDSGVQKLSKGRKSSLESVE